MLIEDFARAIELQLAQKKISKKNKSPGKPEDSRRVQSESFADFANIGQLFDVSVFTVACRTKRERRPKRKQRITEPELLGSSVAVVYLLSQGFGPSIASDRAEKL